MEARKAPTTSGKSGLRSSVNKGWLHILFSSRTESSSPDCSLVSYAVHLGGGKFLGGVKKGG